MKKIVVIGSLNVDFVVNVPNMPAVGETLLAQDFEIIPGGKGANQACALGKLGANVTILGAVGADSYGQIQLNSLKNAGVDVSRVEILDSFNTGLALVTVNKEGNNSIIVIQGANRLVTKEYIDRNKSIIEQCDIVILQLEIPLETVVYAAKLAKELGKTVILDPAPAIKDLPKELIEQVDIIKPNETELSILSSIDNAENHLEEATKILKQLGARCVIATLGDKGVFLNLSDGSTYTITADPVTVVDTTAAGDSFTAALAISLCQGETILSAAAFANRVASIVVTRKGAQSSIPTLEEVLAFIPEKGTVSAK
jgi:ribokinase